MAEICDYALAQDISVSCEKPQKAGMMNKGYLVNFDDVDWATLAQTENIVSKLALLQGRAYEVVVPGKTPFTGTQTALVVGTYLNKFTKTVSIVVLNSGPDVSKNVIDQLANGRFIFIGENKYKGTDDKNTFEIFGLEQGLTASEMTNDKYSEDTEGGWAVTLTEENAPSSGIFFFSESVAATRAALASLVKGS